MINIYIQYSHGGFKTFFIEGKEKELVNAEVTNSSLYDFPQDAHCYFQYGGTKIIYRYLKDGRLDLVVREIPSIHKDGDGRSIPCAVQFIGEAEDRQTLDHIATDIVNDINKFHEFFSMLFRIREGLRIDGNKLRTWINEHNVPFVCETTVPQIKNIANIKSGVILFVPLSNNFGVDDFVTKNVTSELNLPYTKMQEDDCVITNAKFAIIQGKSTLIAGIASDKKHKIDSVEKHKVESTDVRTTAIPENSISDEETIDALKKKLEDKEKEIQSLKEKAENTFNKLTKVINELNSEKKERAEQYEALLVNKKYLNIALGIIALFIIYIIYSLITD